jgi:hypothetical protein
MMFDMANGNDVVSFWDLQYWETLT